MFAMFVPANALDYQLRGLAHTPGSHAYDHWAPVGFCLTILFLIGHHFIALSGSLVCPLMGITSILWLMMRNDAAISPKLSWM
jgi:hypothetical protein